MDKFVINVVLHCQEYHSEHDKITLHTSRAHFIHYLHAFIAMIGRPSKDSAIVKVDMCNPSGSSEEYSSFKSFIYSTICKKNIN